MLAATSPSHRARPRVAVRLRLWVLTTVLLAAAACDAGPDPDEAARVPSSHEAGPSTAQPPEFTERAMTASGRIYLPVYSHIYARSGAVDDLATTISIRNVSIDHAILLDQVNYYDTKGLLIEQFLDEPVTVAPLETLEYFIPSLDKRGGSGANVIVGWHAESPVARPLVEAVMVRSSGSQAYAFTTRGVDIRNRSELPSQKVAPAAADTDGEPGEPVDPVPAALDAETGETGE